MGTFLRARGAPGHDGRAESAAEHRQEERDATHISAAGERARCLFWTANLDMEEVDREQRTCVPGGGLRRIRRTVCGARSAGDGRPRVGSVSQSHSRSVGHVILVVPGDWAVLAGLSLSFVYFVGRRAPAPAANIRCHLKYLKFAQLFRCQYAHDRADLKVCNTVV